MLNSILYKE